MKKYAVIMLILIPAAVYSLDLQFTWTLAEIGAENTDVGENLNININLLKFNWFEPMTGLGVNISCFNYHHYSKKVYWFFPFAVFMPMAWPDFPALLVPPVELMWNPIVKKTSKGRFINLGFYNRIEYGGPTVSTFEFVDTLGIRFFYSRLPVGRTNRVYEQYFNWYASIFTEYSTDETLRLGFLFAL
jgi:hypothetical protein